MITVKRDQIWSDNDPRSKGRTIKIVRVEGDFAYGYVVTPRTGGPSKSVGRPTRIHVNRFRHGSIRGYTLLQSADSTIEWSDQVLMRAEKLKIEYISMQEYEKAAIIRDLMAVASDALKGTEKLEKTDATPSRSPK